MRVYRADLIVRSLFLQASTLGHTLTYQAIFFSFFNSILFGRHLGVHEKCKTDNSVSLKILLNYEQAIELIKKPFASRPG